ncbi:MAG TPA: nucleotidyltransferase domain-containing protein [Blastocatellia bacterium]|nr:nucleotidyltransferase domain-containing protein [Blastocatellia bacterium]
MKNEPREQVVKRPALGRVGENDHRALPFGERITPELIQQICEDIIRLVDPEMIILFGSRAHGEIHEESDLDLFVIVDSRQSNRHIARQIRRALYDYGVPIDLIVRHPEEVRHNLADRNPFYVYHLFEDGVILYERSRDAVRGKIAPDEVTS